MSTPEVNGPPDLKLELFSDARLLAASRAMIGNYARRIGFGDVQAGQISLAVDEALCNVINHGYGKKPDGRIVLSVWHTEENDEPGIHVVIEDNGKQVDPATIKSRDLDDIRPGGLGVFIIREIMDRVVYEQRPEGGMRLTMSRQNRPEEEADDAGDVSAVQTPSRQERQGHA